TRISPTDTPGTWTTSGISLRPARCCAWMVALASRVCRRIACSSVDACAVPVPSSTAASRLRYRVLRFMVQLLERSFRSYRSGVVANYNTNIPESKPAHEKFFGSPTNGRDLLCLHKRVHPAGIPHPSTASRQRNCGIPSAVLKFAPFRIATFAILKDTAHEETRPRHHYRRRRPHRLRARLPDRRRRHARQG